MDLPRYRAGRNVHRLTALTEGSSSDGTDLMTWTSDTQPSVSTCTTKTTAPLPDGSAGYSAWYTLTSSGGTQSPLFGTAAFSASDAGYRPETGCALVLRTSAVASSWSRTAHKSRCWPLCHRRSR